METKLLGLCRCRAMARWLAPFAALVAAACGGEGAAPLAGAPESVFSSEQTTPLAPGCEGLVPDTVGSAVVDTSLFAGHSVRCVEGTTDGRGHVALGTSDAIGRPDVIWTVKPLRGGEPLGQFSGWGVPLLLPQQNGWIVANRDSPEFPEMQALDGWTYDGTLLNRTWMPVPYVVPDFASGALVAFDDFGLKVRRFDSEAAPRSPAIQVAGDSRGLVAAGVSSRRDTLVLFDGSTAGLPPGHLGGRWLSPCGTYLTEVFDTGLAYPVSGPGVLAPLHDGSLVLQVAGQWVARFRHRSTAPAGPAPAWLVERPDTRLVWIRHGKGYALLPMPGESVAECSQEIFLYSKKGHFCGGLTFPVDALPCTTRGINVGPDGTVVQLSPRPGACADASCVFRACVFSWWPNLLGRPAGWSDARRGAGLTSPRE